MCTVGMTEARNVSASFTVGSNNLTVSVSGTGTVTSNVGGISCTSSGGMCTQSYTFGQVVRLTAAPGVGRSFGGWGGTCMTAGMALTCDVTMDASKSATATFNVLTYPVEVEIDAAGWGTAQTPAKEIDCPGDCDETLAHGTTITIQALPNPGYTFEGWVDDTPGATADINLVVLSTSRMLRNELKHRTEFELDLAPMPKVVGDAPRIGQILTNLLVNALHGLPEPPLRQSSRRRVTPSSNCAPTTG